MTDTQSLQFDRAEYGSENSSAAMCSFCEQPVVRSDYLMRATAARLGGAIVGAIVCWGMVGAA